MNPTLQLQRTERAKTLADCFASFPRFCGLLKIPPAGGGERIPFLFSPIQRAYTAARTSRDIILKPRQVYVTTLEAARDLWWFLTKPGARVVVVCQSQTDYGALNDIAYKFRVFFDSLERHGLRFDFGKRTATEWTLPKRDATLRIIQAGASEVAADRKGRGGTVNRLHLTEMAFWGEYAESTFTSIKESVPRDDSEIVNESTANGAAGLFYEQWLAATGGKSAYTPHFFSWWKHPSYRLALSEPFEARDDREAALLAKGVEPECLNFYRWKVRESGGNDRLVRQDFPDDPETCFLVSGNCFFDADAIALAVARAPRPLSSERGLRIWENPKPGVSYVIGADTAEGGGGDPSAAVVYERGTGAHVATMHGQMIPWDLATRLVEIARLYNGATIAPERNNHGHAVIQALQREHKYPRVYRHHDDKLGWLTNEASRSPMLDALDASHRRGVFRTSDTSLLGQMRTFVVGPTGKAEASRGAHDDLVMAAAIGWAVVTRPGPRADLYSHIPHV